MACRLFWANPSILYYLLGYSQRSPHIYEEDGVILLPGSTSTTPLRAEKEHREPPSSLSTAPGSQSPAAFPPATRSWRPAATFSQRGSSARCWIPIHACHSRGLESGRDPEPSRSNRDGCVEIHPAARRHRVDWRGRRVAVRYRLGL